MFKYQVCLFTRKQIPQDADLEEADNAVSCLTKRWHMLEHGMVNLHSLHTVGTTTVQHAGTLLSSRRLNSLVVGDRCSFDMSRALCCRIA
jgi:hypothetical protein